MRLLALFAASSLARRAPRTRRPRAAAGRVSLELVDPKTLRVCADPRNMPFSTQGGEGFENKLAELFASKLGKGLAYEWYPQATGFIRMTLLARRCDVVMGYPLGDDLVQPTNPYYRIGLCAGLQARHGPRRHRGPRGSAPQGQAHRRRRRHAAIDQSWRPPGLWRMPSLIRSSSTRATIPRRRR